MASSGTFCTLSVMNPDITTYTTPALTNGGTRLVSKVGNAASATFGFRKGDGKYYFEICSLDNIVNSAMVGFAGLGCDFNNYPTSGPGVLYNATNGQKSVSSSGTGNMGSTTSYGASWTNGDIIGVAVDWTGSTIEYYKNNSSQGSISISGLNDGTLYYPALYGNVQLLSANFGADSSFQGGKTAQGNSDENGFGDFYYTPPTGYLAMCSANAPMSADLDPGGDDGADEHPGKHFNIVEYTGNATTGQSITGMGFKPDILICKMTSSSQNWQIYASSLLNSRNTPMMLRLDTDGDQDDDQSTGNNNKIISTFDSDGFTLGQSGSGPNDSGRTYQAFGFRVNGGTTVTNNEGNHTSVVQANQKAGISIMTLAQYTSASGVTIGHGLGVKPAMYWHKPNATSSKNWHVYHHSLGATKGMNLNNVNGQSTAIGFFADTEPTTTVLSLGNTHAGTGTGIVYAWAEIEGFSKFGSYVGSGSSDGNFIDCGFKPKWVFIKKSSEASTTYGWANFNTVHQKNNAANFSGGWFDTSAAFSSNYPFEINGRGFKHRNNNTNLDGGSKTYIFGAWADTPFKYGTAF